MHGSLKAQPLNALTATPANRSVHIVSACPLVPSLETNLGIEVQRYRKLLVSVKVPQITFGLLKSEEALRRKGLHLTAGMRKQFNTQILGMIECYNLAQFYVQNSLCSTKKSGPRPLGSRRNRWAACASRRSF